MENAESEGQFIIEFYGKLHTMKDDEIKKLTKSCKELYIEYNNFRDQKTKAYEDTFEKLSKFPTGQHSAVTAIKKTTQWIDILKNDILQLDTNPSYKRLLPYDEPDIELISNDLANQPYEDMEKGIIDFQNENSEIECKIEEKLSFCKSFNEQAYKSIQEMNEEIKTLAMYMEEQKIEKVRLEQELSSTGRVKNSLADIKEMASDSNLSNLEKRIKELFDRFTLKKN